MRAHQQILLERLSLSTGRIQDWCSRLDSVDLARLYADVGFFQAALLYLTDEHWLHFERTQPSELEYSKFLNPILFREFSPLRYLSNLISTSKRDELLEIQEIARKTEQEVINFLQTRLPADQIIFCKEVLKNISILFLFEEKLHLQNKKLGITSNISLYRTYDRLDELFKLNYLADKNMKIVSNTEERLYEGAGVGVQSGYSSVLMALERLNLARDSKFIDLGSGYGRLGMIIGLMRPDIQFTGYEFIQHRVDSANESAKSFLVDPQVQFFSQDLSDIHFKIPAAETYYMYDPFTHETYSHVMNQIVQISKSQDVTIITKGNAKQQIQATLADQGWSAPQEIHDGNICIFKSNN